MARSSSSLSDIQSQKTMGPIKVNHWKLIFDRAFITNDVLHYPYRGSGTESDPFLVEFIPGDPRDGMQFPRWKKWGIIFTMAFATLAVAFVSSAYSGGIKEIIEQFHCSDEVATLGLSLFVLGFAIGPLMWAPMSELYGRQVLFFGTYAMLTIFNAGAAGSQNIQTLIILRFFAGAFGSSPLTNAGGVVADLFEAKERGLAMSVFAAAPFMGPVLGPIVGGFVGQSVGWRWIQGLLAIFTGTMWLIGGLAIPETYAPFLLRTRAAALSKKTGKKYISLLEAKRGHTSPKQAFQTAMVRPWILLFREPIVLLLSIYMAVIYGTLYMMFGAFPIVFQQDRGWSEGIGGLPFLGIAVGMLLAIGYSIPENKRYNRVAAKHGGAAPPEARLPPCIIASVVLPIGLFWFAWTNGRSVPWIVPIIASAPFGFGMVTIFLSLMNYLIDAYTIYAASVLAASSVLRSLFGAGFPLFTTQMYANLGIHWASSVPAFLALACVPFPFLFYKYGATIRMKCKYSAEAARVMESLRKAEEEVSRRNSVAVQGQSEEQMGEKASPRNSEDGETNGENMV